MGSSPTAPSRQHGAAPQQLLETRKTGTGLCPAPGIRNPSGCMHAEINSTGTGVRSRKSEAGSFRAVHHKRGARVRRAQSSEVAGNRANRLQDRQPSPPSPTPRSLLPRSHPARPHRPHPTGLPPLPRHALRCQPAPCGGAVAAPCRGAFRWRHAAAPCGGAVPFRSVRVPPPRWAQGTWSSSPSPVALSGTRARLMMCRTRPSPGVCPVRRATSASSSSTSSANSSGVAHTAPCR